MTRGRTLRFTGCAAFAAVFTFRAAAGAEEFRLTSSAFGPGAEIPAQYTCTGGDKSPPLEWSGAPAGTKSFALIVDDPDAPDPAAPKRTWVHWVRYDIAGSQTFLPENAGAAAPRPPARMGLNDSSKSVYGGPCPPVGRHRYFFKLYALDTDLGELAEPTKAAIEKAMEGHVLGKAELMGTFQKQGG
jgi:Raf kinase inhibitor-like YbhB/YbcL family protein